MKSGRDAGFWKFLLWLEKILFPGYMVNRRVRITLSGWLYLVLILLFGLAAINTGNNLLYLILSVMISLLIASFWLSEMVLNDFSVCRILPEYVYAGEEFAVSYELNNQKKFFPLVGLEVIEKIENRTYRAYFLLVRSRKTESSYSTIKLETRGRMKFNELIVSTRFPFGFFEKGKKIRIADEVIVIPSPVFPGLSPEESGIDTGVSPSGKKGVGDELLFYRPYLPGDASHWIDWKASARSNQVLVKETEQELESSIVIVLNISLVRPRPDSALRELQLRKAFGVAKFYTEKGFRVRLEVQGRGVDFGTGIEHLKRIGIFLALFDDPENPEQGEVLKPLSEMTSRLVI